MNKNSSVTPVSIDNLLSSPSEYEEDMTPPTPEEIAPLIPHGHILHVAYLGRVDNVEPDSIDVSLVDVDAVHYDAIMERSLFEGDPYPGLYFLLAYTHSKDSDKSNLKPNIGRIPAVKVPERIVKYLEPCRKEK